MVRVENVSFYVQVDKARFQVDSFAFQVVQNFTRIKFLTHLNNLRTSFSDFIYLMNLPEFLGNSEHYSKKQPPNWKVVLCFRY